MRLLELFFFLQVLDLCTTILGFRLGANEASPFIRTLMSVGPITGVLLAKGMAVLVGGVCVATRRVHLIGWINYWFAGLVIWNFLVLFRLLHVI